MRLLIELAYKGTHYHGWQIQAGAMTIQEIIQQKIAILTQEEITLVGCGRTDSGVHARQYYAHFDLPEECIRIPSKKFLNAILPSDIAIDKIFLTPPDFHSRFDAISRKYIYRIYFGRDPFALVDSHQLRECNALSLEKLNECSQLILELKEFASFVKSGSGLKDFSCKIFESYWIQSNSDLLEYHIKANRFVRGMVRLIVGMCVNYALDKVSIQQIRDDLKNNRQISKSWSIAAEGLSLVEIIYPQEKMDLWKRLDLGI